MERILVIEDDDTMREGMVTVLTGAGYEVFSAPEGREGLERFAAARRETPVALVLTDLRMEGIDGMEVLRRLRSSAPETVVIMITAFGTIETAVEAMKLGAFDFITKPFTPAVLKVKVAKALDFFEIQTQKEKLAEENRYLKEEENRRFHFNEIIGKTEPMRRVFRLIEKVARTDSSVMIYGESGTGKELVARAIHHASPRKERPFVKVNCAALAEGVLESELFGHEKGAFSGAFRRHVGRFEIADGGTIFLDEIGDISPKIQLDLLHVLQERSFERVGGTRTIHVDVRVICATHRDLMAEIEAGRFREDLYYRLHIVPIHLPPLRERKADIPDLVNFFIEKLKGRTRSRVEGIEEAALEVLKKYPWRGNVRELENVVEQSLVFAEGSRITVEDLPLSLRQGATGRTIDLFEEDRPLPEILEEVERKLIENAYRKAGGVKTETARRLGIKTSALYYKLEKYGLIP